MKIFKIWPQNEGKIYKISPHKQKSCFLWVKIILQGEVKFHLPSDLGVKNKRHTQKGKKIFIFDPFLKFLGRYFGTLQIKFVKLGNLWLHNCSYSSGTHSRETTTTSKCTYAVLMNIDFLLSFCPFTHQHHHQNGWHMYVYAEFYIYST